MGQSIAAPLPPLHIGNWNFSWSFTSPAYASTWWWRRFSCCFFPRLFLPQHTFPAGVSNTRAQTCKDVLMPQAITGNLVRFSGLLKWVEAVVNWQHLQKAMLCLNLLSYFLSVSLFSQSRKSDHCAKHRPKYLFSKRWTFLLLKKCQVNITGHRSFLKDNKTITFKQNTLPWVGVRTSHWLRWSPFTGCRDVSLNAQLFISSKSTQSVMEIEIKSTSVGSRPFQSKIFVFVSWWLYRCTLQRHHSFLFMRSQLIALPYFGRGNKPPAYLLLIFTR